MEEEDKIYIDKVKSLLSDNTSNEDEKKFGSYPNTETEIDDNLDYFIDCRKNGLSPHKSLLFFNFDKFNN